MALGKAARDPSRRTENEPVVSPLPFPSTTNNNSVNSALEFPMEQWLPLTRDPEIMEWYPMEERLPLDRDPEIMEERFSMEQRLPLARDPEIMEERR